MTDLFCGLLTVIALNVYIAIMSFSTALLMLCFASILGAPVAAGTALISLI